MTEYLDNIFTDDDLAYKEFTDDINAVKMLRNYTKLMVKNFVKNV